jgi:uncharacterized protein YcfJ
MKRISILLALTLALGACSQTQQRVGTGAAVGALGGAAVGAIAGGGRGAAVGAVVGGIGGAAIAGATAPKDCWAYDQYGRRYAVVCP